MARLLSQAKRPYRVAMGSESLRLLPAAKPTSLYKGGFGWLANAGSEALPCGGGNGRLQGPLVKGAGFRDCASKRGRLGDSCCGWRDFTVRRWERQAPRPPCKGGWLPRLRKHTRKAGGFLLRVERLYHAAVGSESLRLLPAAKPTSLYKGGLGG